VSNHPQVVTKTTPTDIDASPMSNSTKHDIQSKWDLWSGGVTLLRGVNIWQALVVPEVDGLEFKGNRRVGPPFTQKDFDQMAESGINYVVLSVPGLFTENPPYSLDVEIQENLDNLVNIAAQADLFVTIAFRTGPGRAEWSLCCFGEPWYEGLFNDQVWEDAEAQQAWEMMWQYTAQHYRDHPAVIGYELMVEPDANEILLGIDDPEEFYAEYQDSLYDWNAYYPKIVTAIRAVDADTPIIVGGMGYSNIHWLGYLEPMLDEKIIYDIHQYIPSSEYAFQKPSGNNCYPDKINLNGDQKAEDFDQNWLVELMKPASEYSQNNKARIVVNEYGVKRWVPGAAQFLSDEMAIFEKNGWNYALWEWSPSYVPFSTNVNDFNFRLGPSPDNREQEIQNDLFDALLNYWKLNWVRPSEVDW